MVVVDNSMEERVALNENQEIVGISNLITENLPRLQLDNKEVKPLDLCSMKTSIMRYSCMRRDHQTQQASLGTQNKLPKEKGDGMASIHQETITRVS